MPKSDLTEGEIKFVTQLIGEEPVWVDWVKKINRKDSVQDRLLAVGVYRIYSIKRLKTGKKQIQRVGHILGLKEIHSDDIDKVKLEFGDFRIIVTKSSLGIELPKILLTSFQNVTFTFPSYASPKVTLLPEGRNAPVLDPIKPGIAGGLVETYFAQCDYLNIPPSSDVVTYLEDVCNTGQTHLQIDDVIGASKTSEFAFNPTPLLAALRHNTYFTSFGCHEKSRKEIVPLIADVITHNTTLTSIDLSGMEVEEGWSQIGDALRSNSAHRIIDLILSDNLIGDKAAAAIGAGIAAVHEPGLRILRMANARLTAAGTGAVVKGLCVNRQFANFEEISFSGNTLKGAAMTFSELVASMPQSVAVLKKIVLSNTQVDLAPLIDGIRNTLYDVIEHVDFTGCRMDEHAAKLSVYFFEKTTSIKQAILVGCGLSGQTMANMLKATSENSNLLDLVIDFSSNILDSKSECDAFCKAITDAKNLYELRIREMEFGKQGSDEGLTQIIKSLMSNSCLREIDLSGNFKLSKSKDKDCPPLLLLAAEVDKHATIIGLSVEGVGQNSLGKYISPIFHCVGENSKLQKLSVRGHGFGDAGAKELFDILRWNKSLTSINYDNNGLTSIGWSFIVRCLNVNRTLCEIEHPKIDIAKVVAKATSVAIHDSIFSNFAKIATYSANNRSGEIDERGHAPSKPAREHSYEVRKPSRSKTMVITKVTSSSFLPTMDDVDDDADDDDNSSNSSNSSGTGVTKRTVPPPTPLRSPLVPPPSLAPPPPPPLFTPPLSSTPPSLFTPPLVSGPAPPSLYPIPPHLRPPPLGTSPEPFLGSAPPPPPPIDY